MKRMLPVAAAGLVLAASVAFAQPPQGTPAKEKQERRPSNLTVLPADISGERLIATMREFNRALGVACSFCHVPGNFASDDNARKNEARAMIRMTARINAEIMPTTPGVEQVRISCVTCHGGVAEPDVDVPPPVRPWTPVTLPKS